MTTPLRILSDEVGPIKAATILAALRAHGWEVVRKTEKPKTNVRERMDELLKEQASVDRLRPAKKYTLPVPRWPRWMW